MAPNRLKKVFAFPLDTLVPWTNVKSPAPSVVPAAVASPMAPGHVTSFCPVDVYAAETLYPRMSI